ncbi:hypothetical protein IFO69_15405 [Echinicola sp. CAU 1574]|uniref:Uncharacterized protein n=1 Tax=Echinicola arenosa TaxID=2774144 RepID=A0ABR9AP50_9BACT|nr:hypothetical protein [Echinicola arenosa]MBD8490142.1 hypothetical protein [Echinicola arenosa]
MRKILLVVSVVLMISCSEKEEEKIYQGRLDELVNGGFIFPKDTTTSYIYDIKTVYERDNLIVLRSKLQGYNGLRVRVYNINPISLIREVMIPYEGPEALKGGGGGNIYVDKDLSFFLVGSLGRVGRYDSLGKKVDEWEVDFTLPTTKESFISLETRKGLMYKDGDWIQIGQDPKNHLKFMKSKERLARVEFPLDFTQWVSRINLETGEVMHADFAIPGGYEEFQGDLTATWLMGALDRKRGDYYLGWPYSDTLYRLKGTILEKKIAVKSKVKFTFKPSERIPVGRGATAWVLPKDASQHIFILYDRYHDLFLRASKINESGEGNTRFERTKHYVLQVFSGKWEPIGEYFFDFEGELDLENWFLTKGYLYINKPEQLTEDEYEFYRIDLSRVKKPKR